MLWSLTFKEQNKWLQRAEDGSRGAITNLHMQCHGSTAHGHDQHL